MYNSNLQLNDNLYIQIKIDVQRYDKFFRLHVKKHPSKMFNMPKSDYKRLLFSPTPKFYIELRDKYLELYRQITFNRWYQFVHSYNRF